VVDKAAAAVKFYGWVAVAHLEMKEMRLVFEAGVLGEVEKLIADSLPAVGGRDEELVDPGAFASVLQTIIKANDEIPHWTVGIPRQIGKAIRGVVQKLQEIRTDCALDEGL